MNDTNKVEPQQVQGTITLPNKPPIQINQNAVESSGSGKSGEEFIKSLKEAAKNEVFPNFSSAE
ncbi:hypothetical protein KJ980_03205 [Patescibacteria group bacterium]|nr:hypothetical protein [Patescibacteria group bacterium]MBU4017259.1 hypothetical protein [Patescibacteria group bacterium]MBU4098634.1 hypothetical protein [Patescibacteria group bacterium]